MNLYKNTNVPGLMARSISFLALGFFSFFMAGFRPISVTPENVALQGYDTVAYFLDGRAVKGSPANSVEWNGAVWRFHSKTNLKLFKKDPDKYAPAFGGYCALSVADGEAVVCDPEAFFIDDGKLYVMKNKDILEIWQKDPSTYLAKARSNWVHMVKDAE